MWIPAHRSHAVNPAKRTRLRSATAKVRLTIAIFPLSQYQNGFAERSPSTRRRMRLATYIPPWIATCATPDCARPCQRRRQLASHGGLNDPLQGSRLEIQLASSLGIRYASHLGPVVNRIRITRFQSILDRYLRWWWCI